MIRMISWDRTIPPPKNQPESRESTNPVTGHRRQIAPAGAITLRCNHSTNHLNEEARRRKALKFAPATKFEHISYQNGPPASIFSKISSFRDFGAMCNFHCEHITFLIRNTKPSYFQKILFRHPRP